MERKTKTGEPIVRKAELVAQIESHFEDEMPSLVKATKADLQKLVEKLQQIKDSLSLRYEHEVELTPNGMVRVRNLTWMPNGNWAARQV